LTAERAGWRVAAPADAPFVDALVRADAFAALASVAEPVRTHLANMQVNARRTGYLTDWPDAVDHVITVGGQLVGRLLLAERADRIHLVDLRVEASRRGHGIGTAVLALLCAQADERQLPVTLNVETDSPARRLYAKAGFAPSTSGGANGADGAKGVPETAMTRVPPVR
jgi:GNAT superfamily N-acetyltransferase